MGADTRGYSGHNTPIGEKVKIRRLEDGTLIGVSTTIPGCGEALIDWYANGLGKPPEMPERRFTIIAVKPDGSGYYADDAFTFSGPLKADYFAIGSGSDFAIGAFEAGADVFNALRIAAKCDPWTDGRLTFLEHDNPEIVYSV